MDRPKARPAGCKAGFHRGSRHRSPGLAGDRDGCRCARFRAVKRRLQGWSRRRAGRRWIGGQSIGAGAAETHRERTASRQSRIRRQHQRADAFVATVEQAFLKDQRLRIGLRGQQPIAHQRRGTTALAGGAPGLKGDWQVQLAVRRVRRTELGGEAGGEGIVERRRVGEGAGQAEAAEEQGFGVHDGGR